MSKYLQDISIWVRDDKAAQQWGPSSNFLETLYFSCLPKVETNGVFKVVVVPCQQLPASPLELMVRKPDGYQIWRLFDFEEYFAADKESKKQLALDLLQGGLLETAKIKGWNIDAFHEAYRAVLAKKFVNYLPWSKSVSSPDRKHKAQVWCNYDSDKAEIFVVIFRRGEVVSRMLVTTVKPGDVWIRGAIGSLKWLSPDKVQLSPRNGKNAWEARYEPVNASVKVKRE